MLEYASTIREFNIDSPAPTPAAGLHQYAPSRVGGNRRVCARQQRGLLAMAGSHRLDARSKTGHTLGELPGHATRHGRTAYTNRLSGSGVARRQFTARDLAGRL